MFATIALVACAGLAHAQGSRKDDIVFNAQGRPMAGATVRVCTSSATGQPCSPLAPIYSDAALTQALANPLSADGLGNYTFYAAPGRYEIEISGPGITTKQMPNVILPSDPATPTFTTVTTTSGISAFSLSLTGNLTVSGSVAIGGTLTVGGVPVVGGSGGGGASTNADNQWTNNNRFKGPIPYRDFTAYMPAGGCDSTDLSNPNATGTISSGSHTLAVSTASDFKNGCAVTLNGGGPTATIVMPACTVSGVSGDGSTITVACTGNHNLPLVYGFNQGVKVSSCSGGTGTFNGTFPMATDPSATTFTYYSTGNGTPTSCVVSFLLGWAHGITGSTTFNYWVAPVDAFGGMGPAAGPITITNANVAMLGANYTFNTPAYASGTTYAAGAIVMGATTDNLFTSIAGSNTGHAPETSPSYWHQQTYYSYNWIGFPQTLANRKMTAVYSDQGLGGGKSSAVCVGMAFAMGYSDWGIRQNYYSSTTCPSFVPVHPPTSATAQQLTSLIASGGGTTTLTLADAASNTATTQNVYDDVNPFLFDCLTDQANYGKAPYYYSGTESYCYIPANANNGHWRFNSNLATDTVSGSPRGLKLVVSGQMQLDTWPWFISGYYDIEGDGYSGGVASYSSYPTVSVITGVTVPAAFVLHNADGTRLKGFSVENATGMGLIVNAAGGLQLEDLFIKTGNGSGVPLQIEGDLITLRTKNLTLFPNGNGFPCSVLFTNTNYSGNGWVNVEIADTNFEYHAVCVDSPGGNVGGSGLSLDASGEWTMEQWGQYKTGGIFMEDSGANGTTPGADPRVRANINFLGGYWTPADMSTALGVELRGSEPPTAFNLSGGPTALYVSPVAQCHPDATACATSGYPVNFAGSTGDMAGSTGGFQGGGPESVGGAQYIGYPLILSAPPVSYGQTPSIPVLADRLPDPRTLSVTGTGGGSLAAGQYCMLVVGVDIQPSPNTGLTLPSPEVCTIVGASSSIALSFDLVTLGDVYKDFRLYYGSSPGAEDHWIDMSYSPSWATTVTYTFASTGGATALAPPKYPSAYDSWLYRDANKGSCLYCVPFTSSVSGFYLGIGLNAAEYAAMDSTYSLYTHNARIFGGIGTTLATKSSAYSLTSSDRWVNVTGTTTITAPHADTHTEWIVFNSGSNTVTLQADSGNFNGAASVSLAANAGMTVHCDGSNCFGH